MGEDRGEKIIFLLQKTGGPISGTQLARQLGVSRQVVVQAVAVLRARGYEITATPQGYVLPAGGNGTAKKAVLAVQHTPLETRQELSIMVDCGLKVLDVIVEHPIYGELKGYLMLESRRDVDKFIKKVEKEGVSLLSSLTNGIHLHTVEYREREELEDARAALDEQNFLADSHKEEG